ncbi:XRE family transcriptional regulator (plasmid) [Calothrix sp. NIES-4071]|nr:XRE family transcriptional regulator [Calothrix sp. NIES-4071]BAZ65222.1 XRE family transcriptional regulator [Calothrix sp. NIES-4105]
MNVTDINISNLPTIPISERHNLPDCPAIYFVMQGDTILYIGQTRNLRKRWLAHQIWQHLYGISGEFLIAWLECGDNKLLSGIEKALILHFKPQLNKRRIVDKMTELPSGGIPLSEHDLDWFKVMTSMAESSIRANLSSVLTTFVSECKDSYKEKIEYEANKYGLTFDEVFAIYRDSSTAKEALERRQQLINEKNQNN